MPRDDDDDDDDRPRKRRRDREDEDDEDDRPRRRKRPKGSGDAGVGYVIPYKNVPALVSYYIGMVGSLLCFCGGLSFLSGSTAVVLRIMGLVRASKNTQAHRRVHALVGIIPGGVQVFLGTPFGVLLLI